MSNSKQVAATILNQLGGKRFCLMTGAKQLMALENGMTCKIGRNGSNANYLKITVNSMDLYDMEFIRIHGGNMTTKKKVTDIYCDQLQDIFTEVTGLYTSL